MSKGREVLRRSLNPPVPSNRPGHVVAGSPIRPPGGLLRSPPPMPQTLDDLTLALRAFAEERDWEQFHSPKNLAMALAGEVGELLEHFQWQTQGESAELSPDDRPEVEDEMADVLLYLVRLADKLDVDLLAAAERKLAKNAVKYPAEVVRGSAKKYTEY